MTALSHSPPMIPGEVFNSWSRHDIRLAMIDFDGTLSLLREGWDQIMIPYMVEVLSQSTPHPQSNSAIQENVRSWVFQLNGQPTIKQMEALANEVIKRGGQAESPADYKREYLNRLMREVNQRKALIQNGQSRPEEWLVPGSLSLLNRLKHAGIPLMLASGTDLSALEEEAKTLQIASFFDQGIHGPDRDNSSFTKAQALDQVLRRLHLSGNALLNIGDGFVETSLAKERGGFAIGVAYDANRPGELHAWRAEQLDAARADVIVSDLLQANRLLDSLLAHRSPDV